MADVLADPAVEKCRTEVDDAAERKCPVVGILTGISYISGVDYYQGINKQATQLLPPGKNMRNFPEMAMVSVNCAKYVDMLTHEDLTQAEDYLCGAVAKLNRIGVDFLAIASNTAHLIVDRIGREFPDLPVLHIADCSAEKARSFGAKKIGILGTAPTMSHPRSWLKIRLREHGLETIVPEAAYHERVYAIIKDELSFDVMKSESRDFLLDLVDQLARAGADTVLLGCTELELLVYEKGEPKTAIPLIRSAECHIAAIAKVQAGVMELKDYLPLGKRCKLGVVELNGQFTS
eukprot:GEMP01055573.1.p1 GENE.GEMP01055573.1~~GEMP01055573.1.p1  ORF type:complete len:311 (+),score=73.37 GEMP01055573.1:62-934(+)